MEVTSFTSEWTSRVSAMCVALKIEDDAAAAREDGHKRNRDIDDCGATRAYMQDELPVTADKIALVAKSQNMSCFCCGDNIDMSVMTGDDALAIGRLFDELPCVFANVVVVHSRCEGQELTAARIAHGWKAVRRLQMALRTPMLRVALSGRVNLATNHWPMASPVEASGEKKRRTCIDVINKHLTETLVD